MPQGTEINMAAGARANPDPRRYFEAIGNERGPSAEQEPICLYLETTNRCNLLCETCPRTFEDLEPPADMSWELFTHIVDQVPRIARVVLHGVGEPMMVKALPRMIGYLKERGAYVLFNTNGTLLTERKGRELIAAGLDELRVSLDAAEPRAFLAVRGKDMFTRIVRNVRAFTALQRAEGIDRPLVSLWLTGLKETIDQLPAFVRLAHQIGVAEIHLQRLVFMPQGQGLGACAVRSVRTARRRRGEPTGGGGQPRRDTWHLLQCLGRHRARCEPRALDRGPAVVALPAALDIDVFHRPRKSDPVLHRAFCNARL
jgi:pyruvate-formate lyase-activating enzyme